MKFKEIKNKKFEDLTIQELSFFLHHLEGLQNKYGVPADFITTEIFSDLSGSIKRDNHEELTSIYDTLIVKEIESSVKKIFRERGREYDEYRKEQEEQAKRKVKRSWEYSFIIEDLDQIGAEAVMKAITLTMEGEKAIVGGGFHEYKDADISDGEVGKNE